MQFTVIPTGGVIVGNGAGSIVMILDTGDKGLPQASVAVHVLVTDTVQPFTTSG